MFSPLLSDLTSQVTALFAGVGLWFIEPIRLSPAHWPAPEQILYGAGILFIGYEGFGLVTNAAGALQTNGRLSYDAAGALQDVWSVSLSPEFSGTT